MLRPGWFKRRLRIAEMHYNRLPKWLAASLVVLFLCSLAYGKYPPAIQHEAQPYHRAVVRVDAGQGWGSGTLIAKQGNYGCVITCAHVVKRSPHNVQYAGFQAGCKPIVVGVHPQLDVAALWVWVPEGVEPIPVADSVPVAGTSVELCGFGGGRWGVTQTTVSGHYSHRFAVKTDIGISAISIPGESGGPILSFAGNEPRLAAVNWGGPTATEYTTKPMRHSQGCDAYQLRHWLKTVVAPKLPWVLNNEIEVSN